MHTNRDKLHQFMQDEIVKGNLSLMTHLAFLTNHYDNINQEHEALFKLIDIYFNIQKELKNLDQILNLANSETHLIDDFKEPRLAISEPENLLIYFENYLQNIRDTFTTVEADDKQLNSVIAEYDSIINNLVEEVTKEYRNILTEIQSSYFENILLKQQLEQFQTELGKKIIDIKDYIKNKPPFYVTVDKINNMNQDFYEFRKKWKSIFELIDYARDFKKENMDDIRLNIYLHHKKNFMQAKDVKEEFDVFVRLDVKIAADKARRVEEKKLVGLNLNWCKHLKMITLFFIKDIMICFNAFPLPKKECKNSCI